MSLCSGFQVSGLGRALCRDGDAGGGDPYSYRQALGPGPVHPATPKAHQGSFWEEGSCKGQAAVSGLGVRDGHSPRLHRRDRECGGFLGCVGRQEPGWRGAGKHGGLQWECSKLWSLPPTTRLSHSPSAQLYIHRPGQTGLSLACAHTHTLRNVHREACSIPHHTNRQFNNNNNNKKVGKGEQ